MNSPVGCGKELSTGDCRPRFESQVLCSTCPVTLDKVLTLSQPWGPFLQNADLIGPTLEARVSVGVVLSAPCGEH